MQYMLSDLGDRACLSYSLMCSVARQVILIHGMYWRHQGSFVPITMTGQSGDGE